MNFVICPVAMLVLVRASVSIKERLELIGPMKGLVVLCNLIITSLAAIHFSETSNNIIFPVWVWKSVQ